jgi:hypothetical protein
LVPGALSSGVNWPGHEADHKASSTDEVKNEWSYSFTPLLELHGRHRDYFTFTFNTESLHTLTVARIKRLAGQFAGYFYTIINAYTIFEQNKTYCSEKYT